MKIVFGGASIGNSDPYKSPSDLETMLTTLKKHNITTIDTAEMYGSSEATLGTLPTDLKSNFTFDTKWVSGWKPGSATKSNVIETAKSSLSKLGVDKVDIFYLHAHDPQVPLEETLAGVNEVYKANTFARFGLSNFLTEAVQQVYDICKANNYVLPSVYQVNYSAVTRIPEDTLFPLLRKLNMAIYAYSPIAGGLLGKSRAQIEAGESRFNANSPASMYHKMYNKPSYLNMLDQWSEIADEVGCSKAELAYRWVAYHSALEAGKGDAVIVGASSLGQLEKTVEGLERGELPEGAAKKVEGLWEVVKGEAPVDNFYM